MRLRNALRELSSRPLTRRAALAAAGLGLVGPGARRYSVVSAAQASPVVAPPLVERWAAAWNAHDPAAMAALFTDDGLYEDLAFGGSFQGREGVAEWVTITGSVIPDAGVELVNVYESDGWATAEWIFTGSVIATSAPDASTPTPSFSVRAASVFELEGDLIRRVSDYYNPSAVLGMTAQPAGDGVPETAATPAP